MITDWRDGAWRVRVRFRFDPESVAVFVHRRNGQDTEALTTDYSGKPTLSVHQPGQFEEPAFRLDKDAAQELMDSLWSAGIRPVEGAGSAGQRAALDSHLADMRARLAHHVGVKLP